MQEQVVNGISCSGRTLPAWCREDARAWKGTSMRRVVSLFFFVTFLSAASAVVIAQSDYRVINVVDGGTISGTVKWSGPVLRSLTFPITKDPEICETDSKKYAELERLIVGPQGGVANTVVYLKNITSGKAMDLPEQRRHLDQKHCHYIPHILLVPQNGTLTMVSSDRKSTRLNSSHPVLSRMPSSA